MSVFRSSTGVTAAFLAGKVFELIRTDNGDSIAKKLVFAQEGRLEGYRQGRHWSWGIADGNLIFRNTHDEMTDVFDRIEIFGAALSLVGRLHTLEDDYWIRLIEQTKKPASSIVRAALIENIYRGADPFAGLPIGLYAIDHQGWNSSHPVLVDAAKRSDPIIIAEIGVWKGGSTMTMANTLKDAGSNGVVIAIDTWLGAVDHWMSDEFFSELAMDHGYPSLVRKFMNNILAADLADYVLPLPLDSINAAHLLRARGVRPDVIHLDGGHEYDSVIADIGAWWPLLKPGGIFIGDDYHPGEHASWPGVRRAFNEFFAELGIEQVENSAGKCWITKKL